MSNFTRREQITRTVELGLRLPATYADLARTLEACDAEIGDADARDRIEIDVDGTEIVFRFAVTNGTQSAPAAPPAPAPVPVPTPPSEPVRPTEPLEPEPPVVPPPAPAPAPEPEPEPAAVGEYDLDADLELDADDDEEDDPVAAVLDDDSPPPVVPSDPTSEDGSDASAGDLMDQLLSDFEDAADDDEDDTDAVPTYTLDADGDGDGDEDERPLFRAPPVNAEDLDPATPSASNDSPDDDEDDGVFRVRTGPAADVPDWTNQPS
jgi:hypothetical protein